MNVEIYQDFSIYFLVWIPNLSINGTWQDIDNSFKDPDANEDIRATISKDKIAFYYNDSDAGIFGKYEVLNYGEDSNTIKMKARLRKYLESYDLTENKSAYLNNPDYKNAKIYDYFEEEPGEPLTEKDIENRIANDETSIFTLEYDDFFTIKLLDSENMTITDDEGVTNYKYLFGLDEYDL